MNVKTLLVTGLLLLNSTAVLAQNENVNTNGTVGINESINQNNSSAGAVSTGGDSQNVTVLDDSDDYDSTSLNLQQVYPLQLEDIDQMIQTRLGTINCAVEETGGTEVRIGFPPSIVIKDQNTNGGDCMAALDMMSKFLQAEVLNNMVAYVGTLNASPEYKAALQQDLTNQILDLFIEEREIIEQEARNNTIDNLQTKLSAPKETYEERAQRILKEGKSN